MVEIRERLSSLSSGWREAGPGLAPDDGLGHLAVRGVTVRFGGLVANDEVSLTGARDQVTALIGPNGAGKSTLFDVITGARRPQNGRVAFQGRDITGLPPHARARLGIARTFQNLAVVRDASVFDNVFLGTARFLGYGVTSAILRPPWVRRRDSRAEKMAMESLYVMGLADLAGTRVGDLPYGDQRRVEIARALSMQPSLLLLDEPAAGMSVTESQDLARAVRTLCDSWNIAVFVVEHDLDFVRRAADTAYVLDFGKVIAGGNTAEVLADEQVQVAYMGKDAGGGELMAEADAALAAELGSR